MTAATAIRLPDGSGQRPVEGQEPEHGQQHHQRVHPGLGVVPGGERGGGHQQHGRPADRRATEPLAGQPGQRHGDYADHPGERPDGHVGGAEPADPEMEQDVVERRCPVAPQERGDLRGGAAGRCRRSAPRRATGRSGSRSGGPARATTTTPMATPSGPRWRGRRAAPQDPPRRRSAWVRRSSVPPGPQCRHRLGRRQCRGGRASGLGPVGTRCRADLLDRRDLFVGLDHRGGSGGAHPWTAWYPGVRCQVGSPWPNMDRQLLASNLPPRARCGCGRVHPSLTCQRGQGRQQWAGGKMGERRDIG